MLAWGTCSSDEDSMLREAGGLAQSGEVEARAGRGPSGFFG